MTNEKTPKNSKKFLCEDCNFSCINKQDYTRHLNTAKHKILTNPNVFVIKKHTCECGKEYKHSSSLSAHKRKCSYLLASESESESEKEKPNEEELGYKKLLVKMIEQNSELQQTILDQQQTIKEMIPKMGNNNNSNNTTNNQFNVQLFLNEKCKDALNLTEFLRSLQIGMDDLMKIGDQGYSEGISRILVNGLKNLSVTERPIHCTDTKRDVLYVKDDNIWEKEQQGNPKFQKSIKYLANKNQYIMQTEWAKEHPHWEEDDTNDNRAYHKLAFNMLGGKDDDETLNKRITKQVLPEVKLDKHVVKDIM